MKKSVETAYKIEKGFKIALAIIATVAIAIITIGAIFRPTREILIAAVLAAGSLLLIYNRWHKYYGKGPVKSKN